MGYPLRVLALRQFRYSLFCSAAISLISAGWCRASAEGELISPAAQDPGSQDRGIRRKHPKAPPPPSLDTAVPVNSTLLNLQFEQGDWDVFIQDSAPDSEVSYLHCL